MVEEIQAKIEEKQEAREMFRQARKEKKAAVLGKYHDESKVGVVNKVSTIFVTLIIYVSIIDLYNSSSI